MRWLPSFLVGCLIHAFYVLGGKTACRVPFVRESEQTNLTCYFPENVNKSKKDIAVYHYNENKEKKQDVVVECLWTKGNLECFSLAGYIWDENISDMMTVQLLRVTRNQTGKYACGLRGLNSDDFNLCELYLPSEQSTCKLSEDRTTLTCKFPEDISKTEKGFVVLRYNNYENPVAIVECLWHMNNLQCTTQPGYEPSTTATDSFTVQVLTPENTTGSYQCYMFGSRPDQASICSFVSKEDLTPSDAACPWHFSTIAVIVLIVFGVTAFLCFKFRERLLVCWNHLESCRSKNRMNKQSPVEDASPLKHQDKNSCKDRQEEDDGRQPISIKQNPPSINKHVPATEVRDDERDHLLNEFSGYLQIPENRQNLPITESSPQAETIIQCGVPTVLGHPVADIVGTHEKVSDPRTMTDERNDVRQGEGSNFQHYS